MHDEGFESTKNTNSLKEKGLLEELLLDKEFGCPTVKMSQDSNTEAYTRIDSERKNEIKCFYL